VRCNRWVAGGLGLTLVVLQLLVFAAPASATVGPAESIVTGGTGTTLNPGTGWAGGGAVSFCEQSGGLIVSSYQSLTGSGCSPTGGSSPGNHAPSAVCLFTGGSFVSANYSYFTGWDFYPSNYGGGSAFAMAAGTGAGAHWYTATSSGECGPASDPGNVVTDAVVGTSTCSRTLTDTSAMTAEYTASRTGMVNASVTAWSWDPGDSTGAITGSASAKHTYGALSTQPLNGWTATLTMTVTATAGHAFSDGTTTKTGTCAVRVDFLHPDQVTPGSTGGGAGSTGDSSLDACLPSGWSVLNPLAFVGGVGCVLKVLFIPTTLDTSTIATNFQNAFPFNWIGAMVSGIGAFVTEATTATFGIGGTGADNCGFAVTVPLHDIPGVGGDNDWVIRLPTPPPPTSNCEGAMFFKGSGPDTRHEIDNDVGDIWGWRSDLRDIEKLLLYIGLGTWLIARFPWSRDAASGYSWDDDSGIYPNYAHAPYTGESHGDGGRFDDFRTGL